MDNYTGKIYFFKNIKYNYIISAHGDTGYYTKGSEHILIGESEEISVDFVTDARTEEIEMIEAEIKQRGIEHQVWLDTMSGKIQSLRAIEAPK